MHKYSASLVIVFSLLVTGCTQSPAPNTSQTATATGINIPDGNQLSSSEGLTIFGKPGRSIPLTVEPTHFQSSPPSLIKKSWVVRKQPQEGRCTDSISIQTRIDSNTLLASRTPAAVICTYNGGETLPASDDVGILANGKFNAFSSTSNLVPNDAPRQAYDFAFDGDSVYWLETESTSLYFDQWRIFTANLSDKKSKLLLKAEDGLGLNSPLPAVYQTHLTVKEGRLYFQSMIPTSQYFEKVEQGAIDPEGWEDGDFQQGLLSVKTDGSDVRMAGENIAEYAFLDNAIVYSKYATGQVGTLSPEGTRDTQNDSVVTGIYSASNGSEKLLVEDSGMPDGSYYAENRIHNLHTSDGLLVFTRDSTLYVLNTKDQNVQLLDVASLSMDDETGYTPNIVEAAITHGMVALTVSTSPSGGQADSLVIFDTVGKTVHTLKPPTAPYLLGTDGDQFRFSLEDENEVAIYTVPADPNAY